MSNSAPKNLFPLALTPYERYMLADESPSYPMVFYFQVRLLGIVDQELLLRAINEVISRHPLLGCKVQKSFRSVKWVPTGTGPVIEWDRDKWLHNEPWKHAIDLSSNAGLRIWGEQSTDSAVVTYQFHHACCDGIGASQFLEDVAIAYAQRFAETSADEEELPEPRQLDVDLLETRGQQKVRNRSLSKDSFLKRSWIWLAYLLGYLRKRKVPLVQHVPVDGAASQAGLALRNLKLSKEETRRLRRYARYHNASLNDVLVRDLMVTAHSWNSQNPNQYTPFSGLRRGHICVLVPTSLRGPNDCELPACNVVSYLFLSKPVAAILKPKVLLAKIRDEVQVIRRYQAGWVFLKAIDHVAKIPGCLRLLMHGTHRMCMSTVVLTHMGNMLNTFGSRLPSRDGYTAMGNLLIQDVYGIPPIRRGTYAAFSTVMFHGCLSISLRCCSERFSDEDANRLLKLFAAQLKTSRLSEVDIQQPAMVEQD